MALLGADESNDKAWSGAMMLADGLDDFAIIRAVAEGLAGVKKHQRKNNG